MKLFMYFVIITLSVFARAESELETDDSFFSSAKGPYEDDDLDRAHKKNELSKTIEGQKKTETKVKDEFSVTTPDIMPDYEARAMDQKIVTENKRRQSAILRRIESSSGAVYSCVAKDPRSFQGTHATVIWMISPAGKIMDMAIKSTDIENNEIQKCIHDVAANLDFSSAKTDLLKKSHVEYTYKFKKKIIKSAKYNTKQPGRKIQRKTASQ